MGSEKARRVAATIAVVAAALAFVRLTDALGKHELVRVACELDADFARVDSAHRELDQARDLLEQDQRLLDQRIAFMSKAEHYLVIGRRPRVVRLMLADKEMLAVRYQLRGSVDGVDDFLSLPKARLEVLGKRMNTDWYRPDWLYHLEGVEPPADSAARRVPAAFGPGELFLGGAIVIHGPVSDDVPAEAVDHTYVELDAKSLRAILNAIDSGARVFIE